MTIRLACSGFTCASPVVMCRVTTCSVTPRSRSASVSPTHSIGLSPVSSALSAFWFINSSPSPIEWRRSEWPMMTYLQPTSSSINDRYLAGVCAVVLPVAVLRAQRHVRVLEHLAHGAQVHERRAHRDLDPVHPRQTLHKVAGQFRRRRAGRYSFSSYRQSGVFSFLSRSA